MIYEETKSGEDFEHQTYKWGGIWLCISEADIGSSIHNLSIVSPSCLKVQAMLHCNESCLNLNQVPNSHCSETSLRILVTSCQYSRRIWFLLFGANAFQ